VPWCRIDCNIARHPKLLRAGPLARLLYEDAIKHCSEHLTDGRLEPSALYALPSFDADAADFADGTPPTRAVLAQRLVAAGLWEAHPDGGWVIHDYLEYQQSRDKVEETRQQRIMAGRAGGKAGRGASKVPSKLLSNSSSKPPSKLLSKSSSKSEAICQAHTHDTCTNTYEGKQRKEGTERGSAPHPDTLTTNGTNVPSAETSEPDSPRTAELPARESLCTPEVVGQSTRSAVAEVVAYYRERHPRRGGHIRPGHKDWGTIEARLRDGFSTADLKRAIDGNLLDEWHASRRLHSIDMTFRNAGKVEGFVATAESGPARPRTGKRSPLMEGTRMFLEMQLAEERACQANGGSDGSNGDGRVSRVNEQLARLLPECPR